jgi:hypothetical protein
LLARPWSSAPSGSSHVAPHPGPVGLGRGRPPAGRAGGGAGPAPGRARRDRFRLAVEKLNLKGFIRFLQAEPWDLVINTHFLPAEIIASLRKQERLTVPQVTVKGGYGAATATHQ